LEVKHIAKAFSVASWNVEHFGALEKKSKKPLKPINPIINFLAQQKADVIAVYEVRGRYVFRPRLSAMPEYQFHITEGPQMQEILVGIQRELSALVTQKLEFKSGQTTLRPGVLVTGLVDGQYYPLLFLHLKSKPDPKGFGLRDDMLYRSLKFRTVLDQEAGGAGQANYIFLGDLNTMGFDYHYKKHDIAAADELAELDRKASYRKMRRLKKSLDLTWWNDEAQYEPGSNLDHIVAAKHLSFKTIDGAEVSVRGWPEETTAAKKKAWIKKYSDHALLYFEVQKV
jgi:exonuclease III